MNSWQTVFVFLPERSRWIRDKLYEQTHQESVTASIQPQPIALVSEKEYEYGADAFEIYMKENEGKIKPEMKEVAVQKNEKAR